LQVFLSVVIGGVTSCKDHALEMTETRGRYRGGGWQGWL